MAEAAPPRLLVGLGGKRGGNGMGGVLKNRGKGRVGMRHTVKRSSVPIPDCETNFLFLQQHSTFPSPPYKTATVPP
eukprot:COSAG04_NODE_21488_length_373_cov_0.565693_1_plen_75_part_10